MRCRKQKSTPWLNVLCWLLLLLNISYASGSPISINLNEKCSGEELHICSFSEISATLDAPLVWSNATAPDLHELILRNSIIRILPAVVFELAPKLETFMMHSCNLYSLSPEYFRAAKTLRTLVLQKNRISKLTDKLFLLLPQLEKLELGNNIIHTVHRDAFVNLTQLRYLGLQSNGIRTLMDDSFKPLPELRHIDLTSNYLEELDATTFQYNTKLEVLLVAGNRFSVFQPNSFISLTHLRLLDLSNTAAIDELQINSVHTLQLVGSGVRRLVITERLIRLHAGNNALTLVSVDGNAASVLELDLHSNLLTTLGFTTGMLNLQRLDVSKNSIRTLRPNGSNGSIYLPLQSLTHLNLASNLLEELSADNFLMLPRLVQLDISFNHMLRLSAESFEPLINLQKLYIEGNRLHEFDYELFLRNHAQLKEVGLCDNEWEFHFMSKMVTYLGDHGIHLPRRYAKHGEAIVGIQQQQQQMSNVPLNPKAQAQAQHVGVSGIHPYWTLRDVLAMTTLVVVLIILLMQLHRVMQEEDCFIRCRRRLPVLNGRRIVHVHSRQHRPHRINEEDSESASSSE